MPKGMGVVGGTYIENNYGNDKALNEKSYKEVLNRAQHFFGSKIAHPKL